LHGGAVEDVSEWLQLVAKTNPPHIKRVMYGLKIKVKKKLIKS
jgi:hypothetical protein